MMLTVIYHSNCSDGFCAAWLLNKAFNDVSFIPAQYGEPLPDVGGDVIIADFSYPRDELIYLEKQCSSLMVFDHHKTAEADCKGLSFCVFDMDKCGARLVQEFYKLNQHWLVNYVEDRDLWKWELADSKAINAVIRSYPLEFDAWNFLGAQNPSDLVPQGIAILRYRQQLIDKHVELAQEIIINGHKVLASNCTCGEIISDVAGELAIGKPFGVCWFDIPGKRIYSLRSRGDIDVALIAKTNGGGGHAKAAGFSVSRLDV